MYEKHSTCFKETQKHYKVSNGEMSNVRAITFKGNAERDVCDKKIRCTRFYDFDTCNALFTEYKIIHRHDL